MNAIQFIQQHGIEKARKVVEGAPDGATHFNEALSGHYAKEGMLKMKPQWLWFNSINKEWYYDFAAKDHIHLPDLKRLVESVDLIEHFGNDIGGAKQLLEFSKGCKTIELSGSVITIERLKQAIADYESIYSIPESVRQAILNLEMHL